MEDTARGMAHGGQPERVAEEDMRCHSGDDAGHATLLVDLQDQHCAMLATAAVDSAAELVDHSGLPMLQVQEAEVQQTPEQESEEAIAAALGEQTSIVLGLPRR